MRPFIISLSCIAAACSTEVAPEQHRQSFPLHIAASGGTGDEDAVRDINLYIADSDGDLESHIYLVTAGKEREIVYVNLMKGQPYSIYLMANAGYDMGAISREQLLDYRFYLRFPDGFDHGIPMSGIKENFVFDSDSASVEIPLERLLAKIRLKMDCSKLDDGVKMNVFSTRVGNCPRNVRPFAESATESGADLFPTGYTCTLSDKTFTAYCLENCQHRLAEDLCSYIELDIDYVSDSLESPPGRGLIYRFYLREQEDFCVRRNSLYNITVIPTGNGILTDDSWRVDFSSLRARE